MFFSIPAAPPQEHPAETTPVVQLVAGAFHSHSISGASYGATVSILEKRRFLWIALAASEGSNTGGSSRRPGFGGEPGLPSGAPICRSEERRVGKECRSRWSPYH